MFPLRRSRRADTASFLTASYAHHSAEYGCGGCESSGSWSSVPMKLHRTTMEVLISKTQMGSPQDD
jgi:hypothetical protein